MSLKKNNIKSVLCIDDDEFTLELIEESFKNDIVFNLDSEIEIMKTQFPSQGLQLANKYFFDQIFIDITMPYNNSTFGGIEIYKELFPRYGDFSIIAYSQKVKHDFLRDCPFIVNFLEKGDNPIEFYKKLKEESIRLRKRQSVFVAMPFKNEFDPIYVEIKKSIEEACYRPIRIDEQYFTKEIMKKIHNEIKNCKIFLFVATDKNPNVYYEAGYARALEKEILTLIDDVENLSFDFRDNNAISYEKNVHRIHSLLSDKLIYLTKNLM